MDKFRLDNELAKLLLLFDLLALSVIRLLVGNVFLKEKFCFFFVDSLSLICLVFSYGFLGWWFLLLRLAFSILLI